MRVSLRSIAVVLFAASFAVACGGNAQPKSTERPLTVDEATLLASVQFDNYEDSGAAFQVSTAFLVSNDTLTLQGVVDWKQHYGYAVAVAKGAEEGITEVFWTDNVVLERRPAADALLAGMGFGEVRYFARPPEPDKRLLDRALAIVLGLASTQRDNPQLILQKAGSAYLRTDTLRNQPTNVLRFGERNIYWLDSQTNRMLRFEGNAQAGGAPTVVDIVARGPQTVPLPSQEQVINATMVQELYEALQQGASASVVTRETSAP